MQKQIFTILFTLFTSLNSMLTGPSMTCKYKADLFSSTYGCKVQNLSYVHKNFRKISTFIFSPHSNGKSDEDVKFLTFNGIKIEVIPIVTELLPHIEELNINNAKLKEISSSDLQQFGKKLKILNLKSNELEVLEENLFKNNPNLEEIYLDSNKIRHVYDGAFNGLSDSKIRVIGFDYNFCYETDMYGRGLEIVDEIMKTCKDKNLGRFEMFERGMSNIYHQLEILWKRVNALDKKDDF